MFTTKSLHQPLKSLRGLGPRALLATASCLANRHEPRGHTANWTGTHYASRCEHCRKPIRRVSQGKWVSDTSVLPHLQRPACTAR